MRHAGYLIDDRAGDMRMIIAMTGGPPGGHAINQPPPIRQMNMRAIGGGHSQRFGGSQHLGIGQPEMIFRIREPVQSRAR